jgi:hypothetical protein
MIIYYSIFIGVIHNSKKKENSMGHRFFIFIQRGIYRSQYFSSASATIHPSPIMV